MKTDYRSMPNTLTTPEDFHITTDEIFRNAKFKQQVAPFIGNAKQQEKLHKLMHELIDSHNEPQLLRKAKGYLVDLIERCYVDPDHAIWNVYAALDFIHDVDEDNKPQALWYLLSMCLLGMPFPPFLMRAFISDALIFIDNDCDGDACDDCDIYDDCTDCDCYIYGKCCDAGDGSSNCEDCDSRDDCECYILRNHHRDNNHQDDSEPHDEGNACEACKDCAASQTTNAEEIAFCKDVD